MNEITDPQPGRVIATGPVLDTAKQVLTDCLQASARLYMHFTRTTLEHLGDGGEAVVRDSLRGYGAWRGAEMRQAHAALGEDINVETLIRRWDSASTYVVKDELESEGTYSPHDVSFDVTYCPASLAWKEEGFHRWGHVYCDEFHQAAATSYHPDALVVIPINMMKGDDRCAFRWAMPNRTLENAEPQAPAEVTDLGRFLAPLYGRTDDEVDGMRLALTRTNRLLAGRYLTYIRAIVDRHGKDLADEIARVALTSWATDRGARLARRPGTRGLDAAELWERIDLAPALTWRASLGDTGRLHAIVTGTPLDDTWQHYDAARWAELFWQVSLPAFFAPLHPGAEVRVVTSPERAAGLAEILIDG